MNVVLKCDLELNCISYELETFETIFVDADVHASNGDHVQSMYFASFDLAWICFIFLIPRF